MEISESANFLLKQATAMTIMSSGNAPEMMVSIFTISHHRSFVFLRVPKMENTRSAGNSRQNIQFCRYLIRLRLLFFDSLISSPSSDSSSRLIWLYLSKVKSQFIAISSQVKALQRCMQLLVKMLSTANRLLMTSYPTMMFSQVYARCAYICMRSICDLREKKMAVRLSRPSAQSLYVQWMWKLLYEKTTWQSLNILQSRYSSRAALMQIMARRTLQLPFQPSPQRNIEPLQVKVTFIISLQNMFIIVAVRF